ncbi:hypothetical protein [Terrisporobacter sp.]
MDEKYIFTSNPINLDSLKDLIIEDLHEIIKGQYIYSVDNIVDKLKIQRVYIQSEFIKEMNAFHLHKTFKAYCRACLGSVNDYLYVLRLIGETKENLCMLEFIQKNKDVLVLIERAHLNFYKLTRRLLISRGELIKVVQSKFLEEVERVEINEIDNSVKYIQEYFPIDRKEAMLLIDVGLKDQGDMKNYYGVRTELQVYRRLRKIDNDDIWAKYVIPSNNAKKKGMVRYLTRYDFPIEKLDAAADVFFNKPSR